MLRKEKILTLFVVIVISIFGCSKSGNTNAEKVIAEVAGEPIMETELEEQRAKIPSFAQNAYEGEKGKLKLLNQIIDKKVILKEARDMGLDEEDFVQERNKTVRENAMKREYYIDEVLAEIKVTEEEIRNYYEEHKEEYETKPSVETYHIQVATEEEAKKVLERLKADEVFEDLAKELSQDRRSGKNGGLIGYVYQDMPVRGIGNSDEFVEVAFSLESGEYSHEIVETKRGFHIIKAGEKKEESYKPLTDVRDKVERGVMYEKREKSFDDWLAKYKEKYNVKYLEDQIPETLLVPENEDLIVAKMKNEEVKLSELKEIISKRFSPIGTEIGREVVLKALDVYFFDLLRLKEAEKKGYEKNEKVQKEVEMNEEQALLQIFYENQIKNKIDIPEKELREYYNTHRNEFHESERVEAYIIIVDTKEKALEAKSKLQNGANFQELAGEVSMDKFYADKGGELGWITRQKYISPAGKNSTKLIDALFALEPNELTDIIEGEDGFIIGTITERKEAGTLPFEEAKEKVIRIMEPGEGKKILTQTIIDLREKYDVKIYEDKLIDTGKVVKELFDSAQELQARGKPEEALENYKEIIKLVPDTPHSYKAQFMIGYVYSEFMNDYDNAKKAYKKVLDYEEGDLHDDAEYMLEDLEKRKKEGKSELTKPVEEQMKETSGN